MEIDTFPPQSIVSSKPLIPLPAEYRTVRFDALGDGKLPAQYQSFYLPDVYFPGSRSASASSDRRAMAVPKNTTNTTVHPFHGHAERDSGDSGNILPATFSMSATASAAEKPYIPRSPSAPQLPVFCRKSNPAARHRTARACDHCRSRKTKCSGDHPVCQRCTARNLICHYRTESSRDASLRRIPKDFNHISRSSTNRSERANTTLRVKTQTPVYLAPAISPHLAVQSGTRYSTQGHDATTSIRRSSEKWIPSSQLMTYGPPGSDHPQDTHSALGLTGVSIKPPSTITPLTLDSDPCTMQDITPTNLMSMFNQHMAGSLRLLDGSFYQPYPTTSMEVFQRVSMTDLSHSTHAPSPQKPHHSRLTVALDAYRVSSVPDATDVATHLNPASGSDSTASSPASSSSSNKSSVNSIAFVQIPSHMDHHTQGHFPPGEDFSFLSDPVYFEYLTKSSHSAPAVGAGYGCDEDFRGCGDSRPASSSGMKLQYPMEV